MHEKESKINPSKEEPFENIPLIANTFAKLKFPIFILVIVLTVVFMFIKFRAYEYFISDKTIYLLIEKNNAKNISQTIDEMSNFLTNQVLKTVLETPIEIESELHFANLTNLSSDIESKIDIQRTIGDTVNIYKGKKIIDEEKPGNAVNNKKLGNISNIVLKTNLSTYPNDKLSFLKTELYYKDKSLLHLDLFKKGKSYIAGIPKIHDNYYGANLENIPSLLKKYNIPSDGFPDTPIDITDVYNLLNTKESLYPSKNINNYTNIYLDILKKNNITYTKEESSEINGHRITGNKILINFSQSELDTIFMKFLNIAKNDNELFILFKKGYSIVPAYFIQNNSHKPGFKKPEDFDFLDYQKEIIKLEKNFSKNKDTQNNIGQVNFSSIFEENAFQMELFINDSREVLQRTINVNTKYGTYSYQLQGESINNENFINLKVESPKTKTELIIKNKNQSSINQSSINQSSINQSSINQSSTNETFEDTYEFNFFSKTMSYTGRVKGVIKLKEMDEYTKAKRMEIRLQKDDVLDMTCLINIKYPTDLKSFTIPLEHVFDLGKTSLVEVYHESDKFFGDYRKFQQKNPEIIEVLQSLSSE